MATKKLIDEVTVSISTVMLLLGIEQYAKDFLYDFSFIMILIGLVILLAGPFILKDAKIGFLKQIMLTSVGLILLITGIDYFLEANIGMFGIPYIIIALILFQYHDKISDIFK